MNRLTQGLLAIFLATPLTLPVCAAREPAPSAIVCRVQGEGALYEKTRTALELFERLKAGDRISTDGHSEVELIFLGGQRYLLAPSSRAVVRQDGLEAESGSVVELEGVPAMVDLAPLAGLDGPRQKALAVRLREERGGALHPSHDETLLATRVVLSFDPPAGASSYLITVEDETGTTVYSLATSRTRIEVPGQTLLPGRRYIWYVTGVPAQDAVQRRSAVFRTLDAPATRARSVLVEQATNSRECSLASLLGEIDRGLGLSRGSCHHLHCAPGCELGAPASPRHPAENVL